MPMARQIFRETDRGSGASSQNFVSQGDHPSWLPHGDEADGCTCRVYVTTTRWAPLRKIGALRIEDARPLMESRRSGHGRKPPALAAMCFFN